MWTNDTAGVVNNKGLIWIQAMKETRWTWIFASTHHVEESKKYASKHFVTIRAIVISAQKSKKVRIYKNRNSINIIHITTKENVNCDSDVVPIYDNGENNKLAKTR